jgi:hypothetical protein
LVAVGTAAHPAEHPSGDNMPSARLSAAGKSTDIHREYEPDRSPA